MKNIPSLTGIRGVAALWVVMCHYSLHFKEYPLLFRHLMGNGWIAVDMFFILSGFIMCYVHPNGAQNIKEYFNFLKKRLARIWPVHMVTVVFAMLIIGPAGWGYAPSTWEHIRTFLMMHSWWNYTHPIWNGPNWSLSAEWGAYLFFPLLFLLTKLSTKNAFITLGVGLASYVLINAILANTNMQVVVESGLLRSIPCFAFGVLIYRLKEYAPNPDLAAIGVMLIALLSPNSHWAWLSIPLLAILIWGAQKGVSGHILASRPIVFLGEISFSLYMTHYLVIQTLDNSLPVMWGITLVLAWGMYRLIETPLRKWLVSL